jgi:hypothetical protein
MKIESWRVFSEFYDELGVFIEFWELGGKIAIGELKCNKKKKFLQEPLKGFFTKIEKKNQRAVCNGSPAVQWVVCGP